MEVTETITEGLKREFKVIISASEIDNRVDERLKEIAPVSYTHLTLPTTPYV